MACVEGLAVGGGAVVCYETAGWVRRDLAVCLVLCPTISIDICGNRAFPACVKRDLIAFLGIHPFDDVDFSAGRPGAIEISCPTVRRRKACVS